MGKSIYSIEELQKQVSNLLETKYNVDKTMAHKIAQISIESVDKSSVDLERIVFKIDSSYYKAGCYNAVIHPLKLIKALIGIGIKVYSLDIAGIAIALCDVFELFSYKIDKEEAIVMIFVNTEQSQKCLHDDNIYKEYVSYMNKRKLTELLSEDDFYSRLNHLMALHIVRQDDGLYKSNDIVI